MSDPEKFIVNATAAKRQAGAFPAMKPAREKICGRCGARFRCGPEEGKTRCWCHDLPHVSPSAGKDHDCLCPACLHAAIKQGRSAKTNLEEV